MLFSCHKQKNDTQSLTYQSADSKLDSLSQMIDKDEYNPTLLLERATFYFNNNMLSLAKADIDNSYNLIKNDINILLTRADIYYKLNKTREAKLAWERCLLIDPNNLICRENLTSLLCAVRSNNCESMIDTLSIVSKKPLPISLVAYLKELGEYGKCINLLSRSLDGDSSDLGALNLLSMIYSDTSSFNSHFNILLAQSYFDKILKLSPTDMQVYYNLARFKQDILEYNESLKYYKKITLTDSLNKQVYYNMGYCSMQLEDYSSSIDYFTKSIELDNSLLLAYHARAYVYELNNQFDKSRSDWKYCLMLSPSYIPALKGLSRLK